MTANGSSMRLQSQVQRPNYDGQTTSPSLATSPRTGATPTSSHPAAQLKDHPILGPPRPDEMADNFTNTLISYLLRTVKRQTSITKEKSRRIAEIEQSKKQMVALRNTPSPPPIRGGKGSHPFRSRSPRHSVSVRSPSRDRRSPRRRSPRRSPLRRSPPRCNRRSWFSSSSEDDHDAQRS
jgi:hypothetical protein